MPFVVQSGSSQYTVTPHQHIIVNRIDAEVDSEITLPVIFAYGDEKSAKTVKAKVIKHQRGEKIRVVKFKSKSNYHRQYGPRQEETVLEIM